MDTTRREFDIHQEVETQSTSLSVVIETVNEETGPRTGLRDVLAALRSQTHPRDRLEILVVVGEKNEALKSELRDEHPDVRVVEVDQPTYFRMKTDGIQQATGDVIALLDSDTVPVPLWAEKIVGRVAAGADAVAGKTRYAVGQPFSGTFNFFNFGYIQVDADGEANGFLPNNAAFRRQVILDHGFDPKIVRSGAGHLLGRQLKAFGYRLVYEPEALVFHNMYGLSEELNMRVKAGYDCVNLSALDREQVLSESRYLQRGIWGLLAVTARRIAFDARTAIGNRHDLDIPPYQIPYFLLISPLIRGLEFVAGVVTMVKPEYFKKKYSW